MKFCQHCGKEVNEEAVVCVNCGCAIKPHTELNAEKGSPLKTAIKVFLIISTVLGSIYFFCIPLAWCLPMTLNYFNKEKRGESVSIGFKICTLLFVSLIAGILMMCDNDKKKNNTFEA